MSLEQIRERLEDLLFPPQCPLCETPVPGGFAACPACRERLPRVKGPRCPLCGAPTRTPREFCENCQTGAHRFTSGRGAFLYTGNIREAVLALKYRGKAAYAKSLSALALDEEGAYLSALGRIVLMPVPLHEKRLRERGYNQASLIARGIADRTGLPVLEDVLMRRAQTKASKELSREERILNLKDAFYVASPGRVPPRVLLIDDIYTTGATIDCCAAVLRAAGAGEVCFFTLCTGSGDFL